MKIEVDARGLACPKPVINTKKQLDKVENTKVITIVDNSSAKENILKLAKSMNCKTNVIEEKNNFYIEIVKQEEENEIINETSTEISNDCIYISSDIIGKGDYELGKILMKGYIYTLTETKPYPKNIIFLNSGIKLTSENEDTIENLKILEAAGVQILSCGTCLDFYNVKDNLDVGSITNMYNIVEIMNSSDKVITV